LCWCSVVEYYWSVIDIYIVPGEVVVVGVDERIVIVLCQSTGFGRFSPFFVVFHVVESTSKTMTSDNDDDNNDLMILKMQML